MLRAFNKMLCRVLPSVPRICIRFQRPILHQSQSYLSYDISTSDKTPTKDVGGFAQAFEKHSRIDEQIIPEDKQVPFATLLRNSKLMDLGSPEGRIVTGTIFKVVANDLYIDFGWKFHCVCIKPTKNPGDYVPGAKVRLKIKDLELSTKFLGSDKDLTILEADATLMGLVYSPTKPTKESQAAEHDSM